MLFFQLYKTMLFCFLNIIMYILDIASAIRKTVINEQEILSLKTIINNLDFVKDTVTIN